MHAKIEKGDIFLVLILVSMPFTFAFALICASQIENADVLSVLRFFFNNIILTAIQFDILPTQIHCKCKDFK